MVASVCSTIETVVTFLHNYCQSSSGLCCVSDVLMVNTRLLSSFSYLSHSTLSSITCIIIQVSSCDDKEKISNFSLTKMHLFWDDGIEEPGAGLVLG